MFIYSYYVYINTVKQCRLVEGGGEIADADMCICLYYFRIDLCVYSYYACINNVHSAEQLRKGGREMVHADMCI